MTHFMAGHREEKQIDRFWLRHIPNFLKLYDLLNYGIVHQVWDMDHLNEVQKSTLNRIRRRIEHDICIETDFEKFGK